MKRACTGRGVVSRAASSPRMAQETVPAQPAPFRTGVELVTVDATVLDRKGRPLRGLAAKDFKVSVAGQPRRVVSAEFVDWTPARRRAPQPGRGCPSAPTRARAADGLFVFVVDQNTLEAGHGAPARGRGLELLSVVCTQRDRSALVVMPVGPKDRADVGARPRVSTRCSGRAARTTVISSGRAAAWPRHETSPATECLALRRVAERECGSSTASAAGGGGLAAGPSSGGTGQARPGAARQAAETHKAVGAGPARRRHVTTRRRRRCGRASARPPDCDRRTSASETSRWRPTRLGVRSRPSP